MSEDTGKALPINGENDIAMPKIKTILERFTGSQDQTDVLSEHLTAKLKQAEHNTTSTEQDNHNTYKCLFI